MGYLGTCQCNRSRVSSSLKPTPPYAHTPSFTHVRKVGQPICQSICPQTSVTPSVAELFRGIIKEQSDAGFAALGSESIFASMESSWAYQLALWGCLLIRTEASHRLSGDFVTWGCAGDAPWVSGVSGRLHSAQPTESGVLPSPYCIFLDVLNGEPHETPPPVHPHMSS